ncbi:MAG: 6-phosphogluconolactonase [Microthrixaceae bacterium]
MNHQLVVMKTADEVASLTARTIVDLLNDSMDGGRSSVAFSGGSTPVAMFGVLAGFPLDHRHAGNTSEPVLDWSRVDVFQVDERVAPDGDSARNLTSLEAALLTPRVRPDNVHPIPVEMGADPAATSYASTLRSLLGAAPSIDVVHLGLGPDGHCASLVPGDPVLQVRDRDVASTLDYQGYRRVTLTYPALERAGAIVWQVTGESKASALAKLLAGDPSIPAGVLRAQRSMVIADGPAARLVT